MPAMDPTDAGVARPVTVGLLKAEAARAELDRNLDLLESVTADLSPGRLDVLVTPECFLDGYMVRHRETTTAADLRACAVAGPDDPRIRRAADTARRLQCHLVFGASQRLDDDAIANVAYLIDRRGRHLGTYRKIHCCRFYRPGDELPVFRTDFATVGIVICADRRWPENIRVLRLRGAEIVFNPTWGWHGDGNTALMRTRAHENGIPVCFAHPAQALVCLPDASVGASLESEGPAVLVHEVDLARKVRPADGDDRSALSPVYGRRPDLYGPLCEPR